MFGSATNLTTHVLTLSAASGLFGTVTVNTGANLKLATAHTLPAGAAVNLANGGLDLAGQPANFGNLTGSGTLNLNGATLTLNLAANPTFGGAFTGTGSIVKEGAGTFTVTGTSTATGTLRVNAGTVRFSGNNRVNGGSTLDADAGGTFDLNGSTQTVATVLGTGTFLNSGGSTATLGFGSAANDTLAAAVTGNTNLVKNGTGVSALTNPANTFTGTTVVNGGTLQLGAPGVLPAGTRLTVGTNGGATPATFDLLGQNQTLAGLSSGSTTGARLVTNALADSTAVLTVNGPGTFAGSLVNGGTGNTGILALTKTGGGTLVLTGANPFTGPTVVNGGTLQAAGANALQSTGSITVHNGGTLETTAANAVSGNAPITVHAGGTLLLGGAGATANAVHDAAPVVLAGGKVTKGNGVSEGTGGSSAANGNLASVPGLGALTLAATGSKLDFGTGSVGTLVFDGFTSAGFTLTVDHWSGVPRTEGSETVHDRLVFAHSLNAADLNHVTFSGFGVTGALQIPLADGYFEVVPVPEPATWLAGFLSVAATGWAVRRRRR